MLKDRIAIIFKYINIINILIQSVNLCAIIYALVCEYRDDRILFRFESIPLEYLIFWGKSSLATIAISLMSMLISYVLQHKGTIYRCAAISLVLALVVFGFYFRKICGL